MTVTYDKLDVNSFHYGAIEKNRGENQGRNVRVLPHAEADKYDNIEVQLSKGITSGHLSVVFGFNPKEGDNPLVQSVAVAVTPEVEAALDSIDTRNIDAAVENGREWFGKSDISKENITENSFYSFVKRAPTKAEQSPLVNIKIRFPGHKRPTDIHVENEDGTLRPGLPSDIQPRTSCIFMVATTGLWFTGKRQFGMSLYATNVIVKPTKRKSGLGCFVMAEGEAVPKISKALPPSDDAAEAELDDENDY